MMIFQQAAYDEGVSAYRVGSNADNNPYGKGETAKRAAWDNGYWAEHDASYEDNSDGMESGYGDFYDMDAVSQGMYDDDPNVYDGTYSEE